MRIIKSWMQTIAPMILVTGVTISAEEGVAIHETADWSLRLHVQTGLNAVAETNLFWDLAASVAENTIFDADAQWLEAYIEPGISFEHRYTEDLSFFGKASLVASYTSGIDAFDTGNTGRTTLEEGFLGMRSVFDSELAMEATLGPQVLKVGNRMLINNGGGDGFERGALKFGPREAWEMAGVFKLSWRDTTSQVFYIDANESSDNDSKNRLIGFDTRWDGNNGAYLGATYLKVTHSEAPYPQAAPAGDGPPTFLPGAREGLNSVNLYGRTHRLESISGGITLSGDFAYQWDSSEDLRAWAGRIKVDYTRHDLPWRPTFSYAYQIFSGDDPNTSDLERFDPLYYDGSPSAWATGSKSAMVFINSNVQSHNLSAQVMPSPKDIVTLRYAHVRAHELRSPIQFGQATRLEFSDGVSTVVSGVTAKHLSDDVFLEYTRIISPNIFLTSGLSVSLPGAGIEAVANNSPAWTGGFINVVINY